MRTAFSRTLLIPGLLLAMLVTNAASADTVHTVDGSTLQGKITGVANSTLQIETAFAGPLSIPLERVAGIRTDEPCHVSLASGNVLIGALGYAGSVATIDTTLGTLDISKDAVAALWRPGGEAPAKVALREAAKAAAGTWTFQATGDLANKSGNTDRMSFGGGISATLTRPDDRLAFFAAGERVEEDDVTTSKELKGGTDYERSFRGGHSWYTRLLLEYDQIDQLDLRTTAALGYGYYWLKSARHVLRNRAGLLLRQEAYADGRSEQTVGIDLGLHHMLQATEWLKLLTDVTCTPSVEDFADYRLNHESSLETPLGGSDLWKLRLGIGHRYNSNPAPGSEKLDRSIFVRLVLNWD